MKTRPLLIAAVERTGPAVLKVQSWANFAGRVPSAMPSNAGLPRKLSQSLFVTADSEPASDKMVDIQTNRAKRLHRLSCLRGRDIKWPQIIRPAKYRSRMGPAQTKILIRIIFLNRKNPAAGPSPVANRFVNCN